MLKVIVLGLSLFDPTGSERLERYRQETLETMKVHRLSNPDCELNELYYLVQTIPIEWFNGDSYSSAYYHNGTIYINRNIRRSKKEIVVTILHEAIHAYDKCINDSVRKKQSICKILNTDIYYSTDISNALKKHLYSKDIK